jgi:ABC-type amino acid transport substrate-binding protein
MRRRLVWILASTAVVFLLPIQSQGAQPLSGTLKKIKDAGTMVIGYRENSRPFSFLGPDGKPTGYSIDLCQRIATAVQQELGLPTLEIKYVPVTVDTRIQAVANGTVDIECGSTTTTISRQEQVDFTNPTFLDGGGLLVQAGSGITGVGDLGGKRVAVIPGTTTELALKNAIQRSYILVSTVIVKDHNEGLSVLESGMADAYASDRTILIGLAVGSKDPGRLALAESMFSYEPYGFMLSRGDASFRLVANRTLARIYRTEQILQIFQKWFGKLGRPTGALLAVYLIHGIPE